MNIQVDFNKESPWVSSHALIKTIGDVVTEAAQRFGLLQDATLKCLAASGPTFFRARDQKSGVSVVVGPPADLAKAKLSDITLPAKQQSLLKLKIMGTIGKSAAQIEADRLLAEAKLREKEANREEDHLSESLLALRLSIQGHGQWLKASDLYSTMSTDKMALRDELNELELKSATKYKSRDMDFDPDLAARRVLGRDYDDLVDRLGDNAATFRDAKSGNLSRMKASKALPKSIRESLRHACWLRDPLRIAKILEQPEAHQIGLQKRLDKAKFTTNECEERFAAFVGKCQKEKWFEALEAKLYVLIESLRSDVASGWHFTDKNDMKLTMNAIKLLPDPYKQELQSCIENLQDSSEHWRKFGGMIAKAKAQKQFGDSIQETQADSSDRLAIAIAIVDLLPESLRGEYKSMMNGLARFDEERRRFEKLMTTLSSEKLLDDLVTRVYAALDSKHAPFPSVFSGYHHSGNVKAATIAIELLPEIQKEQFKLILNECKQAANQASKIQELLRKEKAREWFPADVRRCAILDALLVDAGTPKSLEFDLPRGEDAKMSTTSGTMSSAIGMLQWMQGFRASTSGSGYTISTTSSSTIATRRITELLDDHEMWFQIADLAVEFGRADVLEYVHQGAGYGTWASYYTERAANDARIEKEKAQQAKTNAQIKRAQEQQKQSFTTTSSFSQDNCGSDIKPMSAWDASFQSKPIETKVFVPQNKLSFSSRMSSRVPGEIKWPVFEVVDIMKDLQSAARAHQDSDLQEAEMDSGLQATQTQEPARNESEDVEMAMERSLTEHQQQQQQQSGDPIPQETKADVVELDAGSGSASGAGSGSGAGAGSGAGSGFTSADSKRAKPVESKRVSPVSTTDTAAHSQSAERKSGNIFAFPWASIKGTAMINRAMCCGFFKMARWLYARGCRFTPDGIHDAIRHGHLRCVKWALGLIEQHASKGENDQMRREHCPEFHHTDISGSISPADMKLPANIDGAASRFGTATACKQHFDDVFRANTEYRWFKLNFNKTLRATIQTPSFPMMQYMLQWMQRKYRPWMERLATASQDGQLFQRAQTSTSHAAFQSASQHGVYLLALAECVNCAAYLSDRMRWHSKFEPLFPVDPIQVHEDDVVMQPAQHGDISFKDFSHDLMMSCGVENDQDGFVPCYMDKSKSDLACSSDQSDGMDLSESDVDTSGSDGKDENQGRAAVMDLVKSTASCMTTVESYSQIAVARDQLRLVRHFQQQLRVDRMFAQGNERATARLEDQKNVNVNVNKVNQQRAAISAAKDRIQFHTGSSAIIITTTTRSWWKRPSVDPAAPVSWILARMGSSVAIPLSLMKMAIHAQRPDLLRMFMEASAQHASLTSSASQNLLRQSSGGFGVAAGAGSGSGFVGLGLSSWFYSSSDAENTDDASAFDFDDCDTVERVFAGAGGGDRSIDLVDDWNEQSTVAQCLTSEESKQDVLDIGRGPGAKFSAAVEAFSARTSESKMQWKLASCLLPYQLSLFETDHELFANAPREAERLQALLLLIGRKNKKHARVAVDGKTKLIVTVPLAQAKMAALLRDVIYASDLFERQDEVSPVREMLDSLLVHGGARMVDVVNSATSHTFVRDAMIRRFQIESEVADSFPRMQKALVEMKNSKGQSIEISIARSLSIMKLIGGYMTGAIGKNTLTLFRSQIMRIDQDEKDKIRRAEDARRVQALRDEQDRFLQVQQREAKEQEEQQRAVLAAAGIAPDTARRMSVSEEGQGDESSAGGMSRGSGAVGAVGAGGAGGAGGADTGAGSERSVDDDGDVDM